MYIHIYICIFASLYLYVPDEGRLLPKYRDCTTSNDFELYIYIYNIKIINNNKNTYMYRFPKYSVEHFFQLERNKTY